MNGELEKMLYEKEVEKRIKEIKTLLGKVKSYLEVERLESLLENIKSPLEEVRSEVPEDEEKREKARRLLLHYSSRIGENQPEVVIVGEYHWDLYHKLIEGKLISFEKPKYVLMEGFDSKREEEVKVEEIAAYIEELFKNPWKRISEEAEDFLNSLPDDILRRLNDDDIRTIVETYKYDTILEVSLHRPIILSAYEVGAKIAGCDDENAKNSQLEEMFRAELQKYSLKREETMANRILEYLNKIDEKREETMANRILEYLNKIDEREKREMIRNYRVPVIAIIGRKHTDNVAQKLREKLREREKEVKVEVINLEPIEGYRVLTQREESWMFSYFILSHLEELSSLYKRLYGNKKSIKSILSALSSFLKEGLKNKLKNLKFPEINKTST